jgi:hypothetical protein
MLLTYIGIFSPAAAVVRLIDRSARKCDGQVAYRTQRAIMQKGRF